MKLIYLANIRMPTEKAHGIQIMKMCEAFAKAGIDVELVVAKRRNPIEDDPFKFFGVKQCFKITYIPTFDLVGVIPKIGFYIQSLTYIMFSKLYLFRKPYDILFTREVFVNGFFNNTVLELHTIPQTITSGYLTLVNRSKLILVLTKQMQSKLTSKVKPQIHIAPDAVDFAQFAIDISKDDARRSLSLPVDKKIVVYTGHLYPWKGVDTLIAAARTFTDEYLFVLVGGTEKDIAFYKRQLKSVSNIEIAGRVSHETIPLYLRAADVVVVPNSAKFAISRDYTSPMKVFEYMASGTPIVVAELPSLRNILDTSTAFFFEPDNPASCATTLREAFTSNQAKIKAKRARAEVAKYTWDNRARSILRLATV